MEVTNKRLSKILPESILRTITSCGGKNMEKNYVWNILGVGVMLMLKLCEQGRMRIQCVRV